MAQPIGLWEAIRHGQVSEIEDYLASGGDPNARVSRPDNEEYNWPLLQIALFDREEAIALALLRAGARFGDLNVDIDLIVGEGLPEFLSELFEVEPQLLAKASRRRQQELLYPAASKGYYQVVEVILAHARTLNVAWDADVLSEAVARALDARQDDIARMLLQAGARPDGSVMHLAARSSSPGMIRFLVSLGADVSSELSQEEGAELRTPLDFAKRRYQNNRDEQRYIARLVIFELIRAGAADRSTIPEDVPLDGLKALERQDGLSETFIEAARLGYFEVVEAALATARIDEGTLREALSVAFRSLHNDIARLLIDRGVPIDGGPLHAAAAGNSPGLVRLLFDLGADANEIVDGETPVQSWWERARVQYLRAAGDYVLHELIKGGADVCWLKDEEQRLSTIAANFLHDTATECWP